MKNRHYIIFVIILAALTVIYIAQRRAARITTVETGYVTLFPDLKADEVTKIKVYQKSIPDAELILVKKGKEWVVENRFNGPADESRVTPLLTDLASAKGELRSTSAENVPTFWLGDDEGVHMELYGPDDKVLADFLFGKKGEAGETTFVRKKGENKVYSALLRLNSAFQVWDKSQPLDPKRWLEWKLANIQDWSTTKRVEFQFPDTPIVVFEKQPGQEQVPKGKELWTKVEPADTPQPKNDDIIRVVAATASIEEKISSIRKKSASMVLTRLPIALS